MLTIPITPAEIESGLMTEQHLAAAVRAVQEDGFVVLKDAVDPAHIAVLRERMFADVEAFVKRPDAPFNFNTGNVQQDPPPFPPYLFRDVLCNDMAIAVTKNVIGPGIRSNFYSGNTAIRSEQRQPVHADMGQLWRSLPTATPAFACVVNVALVDFSPENGSTEIWPGTHTDTTISLYDDIKIPPSALDAWRERTTPLQPTMSAGSLLIRDIRLWHAGMPNHTDTPRPMIAMIHYARWWENGAPLKFPKGTEAIFQHPDLTTHAEFVDGEIDYVHAPSAYDYRPQGDAPTAQQSGV